jgi:hypothetical protein
MRTAFRLVATLTSLAVIVQVGFAGYGAFNAIDLADDNNGSVTKKSIENGFDPHGALGTIVLALMLILVLVSVFGGRIKPRIVTILFVLGIVQMLLAWGGTSQAWVGFLHGINALAIAGIAGSLAGAEWREARVASTA